MDTYGLLIAGAIGSVGWFLAWLGQRAIVAKDRELSVAVASETAAKAIALDAQAIAATAAAQRDTERTRGDRLQVQLDAERKSRQELVDAMARANLPVGPAVVGSALDGLYKDSLGSGGGQGAGSGSDRPSVPGQPAGPTGTAPRR